jgi:hypothetical protein
MPALLTTNLSDSTGNNNTKSVQSIAFMQIDCEVVDTQLIYFKLDELPTNYMKIIHQDQMTNSHGSDGDSHHHSNKQFYNHANSGF